MSTDNLNDKLKENLPPKGTAGRTAVETSAEQTAAIELEARLRAEIGEKVKEYYNAVHKPRQQTPFVPSHSLVQYAGRIWDENELVNLVDSSLDFKLTTDRFGAQFETKLKRYLGLRHAMLVNSGSSANLVAFRALTSPLLEDRQIKPGDEVITVACGFPTTVAPMLQYGCVPVFLDVTLEDGAYSIDCSQLEAALSPRTRAVMVAHTLGNPFELDIVVEFCKKHNLWLVEDNCDALGSRFAGKLTGTFGDIATSSFYPAHHITTGEGGAVYMNSPLLKRTAESFRDWGRDCWCEPGKDNTCGKRFEWELGSLPMGYDHKYTYRHFGFNLKVTDMQAAVGLAQMDKLESFVEARKRNWQILRDQLNDLEEYFILPNATPNSDPSWFGFILTVRKDAGFTRNAITQHLESHRIQTRVLFAGNLLRHPLFDEYHQNPSSFRTIGALPNSDTVMTDTFWIGVYPALTETMLAFMVDKIRSYIKK